MRIIVDVMGGDNAPAELVRGACRAAEICHAEYTLVGLRSAIEKVARENELDISKFEIVDAKDVVEMTDDPIASVRKKSESSMMIGLRMLAEEKGDAFVSTGNTGALFTGSSLIVRRIKGIQRAGIATVLPMNTPVLLLDSGANLNVTPEYLEAFAMMGSVYMNKIFGIKEPRVGLLNNGSEECKGTQLQIDTYKRLSENDNINFVGNIEANKVPFSVCDVLVTDGFTGNILIKNTEGMGRLMIDSLKGLFLSNGLTKVSALLVKKQLGAMKKKFDTTEYGGAPILGLRKPVIKAHGNSNAKAFANAIRQAYNFAQSGIINDITDEAAILREKRLSQEPDHGHAALTGDEGIK